jgi:hypothetical protein
MDDSCVSRGRFEEASQLLAGLETHGVAAEASAALHLAQGQASLAGAVLERRLEALGDGLPAVPLLRLLVEVRLTLGEDYRFASAPGVHESAEP